MIVNGDISGKGFLTSLSL